MYMSSASTNNGGYSLTVTFAVGTDPAIAQVNVQNRVALATPRLPTAVTQTGVSVRTRSTSMLMGVAIYSPKGSHDEIFISNYASINVRDVLARLPGVGEAGIFGPVYSMRIWMNPDRMQALGITASGPEQRDPGSERTGLRRPARLRACAIGPGLANDGHGARPPLECGGVRRHRGANERGWRDRAPARRGPRRTRRPILRFKIEIRRPAQRDGPSLPVAERERPVRRQCRQCRAEAAGSPVSRTTSPIPSSSTPRPS